MTWSQLLIPILSEAVLSEHQDNQANPRGVYGEGAAFQKDRLEKAAKIALSIHAGDLLEIGAYKGDTTVRLAAVARDSGRKVVCIDPWTTGTQNCSGTEYEEFVARTEPWREVIETVRISSQEPQAVQLIQRRQWCFVFVDGLHTEEACLNDIITAHPTAGLIVVDDVWWSAEVRNAALNASLLTGRQLITLPWLREAYLLPHSWPVVEPKNL